MPDPSGRQNNSKVGVAKSRDSFKNFNINDNNDKQMKITELDKMGMILIALT